MSNKLLTDDEIKALAVKRFLTTEGMLDSFYMRALLAFAGDLEQAVRDKLENDELKRWGK